ncbi:hypothetical protein SCOR_13785 [Sulfidibacter corallicola]|uniref:Uncharacterized protein n=1 Tax=Sulfidibacter corallicola TaxID=2818388 RepID=A0A8A4TFT0_SULCO|nr:hypothetical protein [Sulfidibacter corallicola]QTD47611.1 hypothetical protein J3U87_18625 [Sulfidibacter corallicola]
MSQRENKLRLSDIAYVVPIVIFLVIFLIALGPFVWMWLALSQTMGGTKAGLLIGGIVAASLLGCGIIKWMDGKPKGPPEWKAMALMICLPFAGPLWFMFAPKRKETHLHLAVDHTVQEPRKP